MLLGELDLAAVLLIEHRVHFIPEAKRRDRCCARQGYGYDDFRFLFGSCMMIWPWLQQHEEAAIGQIRAMILPCVAAFQCTVIKGTAEDHGLFESKRPSRLIASCVALEALWFLCYCSLELVEEAVTGIGWKLHFRSVDVEVGGVNEYCCLC